MSEVSSSVGPEERRSRIIQELVSAGQVPIDELARRCGVSRMTVHRDLDILLARGLLRKGRGGPAPASSLLVESNFHYRMHQRAGVKRALALAAARHIASGQVVVLDDSTTTLPITDSIRTLDAATVITNSLPIVEALEEAPHVDVICTGGHLIPTFRAFFGLACEASLSALRADIVFLSTSAVRGHAVQHQSQEVVRAKRAMMQMAERRVLVVDHTKFGRTALNNFARMDEFDHIIVDDGLSAETAAALREQGLSLEIVEAG